MPSSSRGLSGVLPSATLSRPCHVPVHLMLLWPSQWMAGLYNTAVPMSLGWTPGTASPQCPGWQRSCQGCHGRTC